RSAGSVRCPASRSRRSSAATAGSGVASLLTATPVTATVAGPGSHGRTLMARARVAREPDPRTPVLVGAGQSSDPMDAPGYRRSSPVELAAEAARAALADAGADPVTVAAAIDTVAAIRQFEISVPGARQPFGGSDNPPRSVAARIGADPR